MFVPNVYWGEVILTASYLINMLPTHVLNDISPIKHMLSLFSSPLMLSLSSRVFGYVAFVHSHNSHSEKLDPRAIKCVFIVRLFDSEVSIPENPIGEVDDMSEVSIPKNPIEDVINDMPISLRKGKRSCI
ncbi:Copia protein, partial [Mucuna pruriens]